MIRQHRRVSPSAPPKMAASGGAGGAGGPDPGPGTRTRTDKDKLQKAAHAVKTPLEEQLEGLKSTDIYKLAAEVCALLGIADSVLEKAFRNAFLVWLIHDENSRKFGIRIPCRTQGFASEIWVNDSGTLRLFVPNVTGVSEILSCLVLSTRPVAKRRSVQRCS